MPQRFFKIGIKISKKLRRWLLGSITGIMVLAVAGTMAANYIFEHYADRIIGRFVKQVVYLKSDGLYRIDYDTIRLSFFNSELHFTDFKVIPDTAKFEALKAAGQIKGNMIHVEVPSVSVKGVGLGYAYFTKEIRLKNVVVSGASVRMLLPTGPDTARAGIDNLFSLISDRFKLFQIKKLELHEGSFAVYADTEKVESINHIFVEVDGFSIDRYTVLKNKRLFRVNDFKITVRDNRFRFEKEKVGIKVGELSMSLSGRQIVLSDLRVRTLDGNKYGSGILYLPQLQVNNLDFEKLYFDNEAYAGRLMLSGLRLDYDGKLASADKQAKRTRVMPDIYAPISTFIKTVSIDDFILDSASFKVNINKVPASCEFLKVQLSNIFIDSTAQDRLKEQLYADDMTLVARGISTSPRANTHLRAAALRLQGKEGLALISDIDAQHTSADSSYTTFSLPQFRLVNFSFTDFLLRNKFMPDSLFTEGLRLAHRSAKNNSQESSKGIVSARWFFDSTNTEEDMAAEIPFFEMKNGSVALRDALNTPTHRVFGLQMTGTYYSNKPLWASLAETRAGADSLWINRGTGTSLTMIQPAISLPDSLLTCRWAGVNAAAGSVRVLGLGAVTIKGFDSWLFVKTNQIHCALLESRGSFLEYYLKKGRDKKSPAAVLPGIQADTLRLVDAKFLLKEANGNTAAEIGRFNCEVTGLQNDTAEARLFPKFERMRLEAQRIRRMMPDSMHVLQISALTWNSDSGQLSVQHLKLLPQLSSLYKNYFRLFIPEIQMSLHVPEHPENLFELLHFRTVRISGGDLFSVAKKTPSAKHKPLVLDSLMSGWPHLRIDLLEVNGIKIKVRLPHNELQIQQASFNGKHLYFNTDNVPDNYRFFHEGDFDIRLSALMLMGDSSLVEAGRLEFHSATATARLQYPTYKALNYASKMRHLSADSIEMIRLNWWQVVSGQGFMPDGIHLHGAYAVARASETSHSDVGISEKIKQLPDKLRPLLGRVVVGSLVIDDARLKLLYDNGSEKTYSKLSLQIDSLDLRQNYVPEKFMFANNVTFYTRQPRIDFNDSMYALTVEEAGFSTGKNTAWLAGVHLKPKVGRYEFANNYGVETDRIDLKFEKLELLGIDFEKMIFDNHFKVRRVALSGFSADIFRDKRLPDAIQSPPMPGQLLRGLAHRIHVDTMDVSGRRVAYAEHAEAGSEAGEFFLTDLNMRLLHVSNDSAEMHRKPMLLHARGWLMGTGSFDSRFTFFTHDTTERFEWTGDVASMSLTDFNPILLPVGFLSIKAGDLQKMRFDIRANKYKASGTVWMYYKNLSVNLVNKRKHTDESVISFLANSLVLRKNNPHYLILRKGRVDFERNQGKSIFNYWVKSLLTGIKSSVGLYKATKRREDEADTFLPEYD